MKKACENQCDKCPFRRTSLPGYLGAYDGPAHIHSSLWHTEPFFCHTRTNYRRAGWLERAMRDGNLCLGALIFVGRETYFPKSDDPEVQSALRFAMEYAASHPGDVDVMEAREFIDYHTRGTERNEQAFADIRAALPSKKASR